MAEKQQIINALRLINAKGIGPLSYFRMVDEYGTEENALATLEKINKLSWSYEKAEDEFLNCQKYGIKIITYKDEEYPLLLKQLSDYPPVLYVKGNMDALKFSRSVAIVGARSASINGCNIARKIAEDLAEKNICIISGMARGIDTAAHYGALNSKNGCGQTIAVLGTGVDVIYPLDNKDLYNNIAKNGCIVSEFPLKTVGNVTNFPRRNRIIAGLSQGVLVVEASMKSGSLITADWAIKQGKTLFAVPGTPMASKSSGTNYLIKKGAFLAEEATDVLPYLTEISSKQISTISKPKQKVLVFENNNVNFSENDNEEKFFSWLDYVTVDGVDVDELLRQTGKSAAELSAEILEMELKGIVQKRSNNRVALIK